MPDEPMMRTGLHRVLGRDGETADLHEAATAALGSTVVLCDDDAPPRLPVVLCLWSRCGRLPSILRMIARQTEPCDLYLWNNKINESAAIEAAVLAASELPARVILANSSVNIGGFGRFFWARQLASTSPYVVFIDDDELLDDHSAATFLGEVAPGRISSAWGFSYSQRYRYWKRDPAPVAGAAKYCGTGGMIADTTIFRDDRLFQCPKEFWFCEDIWLSYFASTVLGWSLSKSAAEVGWLLDDAAQYKGLSKTKSRFFRRLNYLGGWVDPPGREP
jgi:hypothetical protein